MKHTFIIVIAVPALVAAVVLAQPETPVSSPATSASELQELRDEVRALTDTVKQLQQQVKNQQNALDGANIAATPKLPQQQASPALASATPGETPPSLIPT